MGAAARRRAPAVNAFDRALADRLDVLQAQGLRRELRRVDSAPGPRVTLNGRVLLNFASNDYLGLAAHPALKEAAIRATEKFGAGSGASRLICGSLAPHHELEERLAAFKGTEAALSFSSGYATAIGAICALLGKGDVIILDKLVHACIVDAAKLSGATLRVFKHNDLNRLEELLRWSTDSARTTHHAPRNTLVATESVFSMDGDQAPLRALVELKERFGAWLMVDEAHATGLYGPRRAGLADELGLSNRIEMQMGTLGKALGAAGGYIAGSRVLVDFLVNRARSFIFSTAPVPAQAGAAQAAIALVQSPVGEQLCAQLWERVAQARVALASPTAPSAILPVILGDESVALAAAAELRERGLFVPAIRYPTVARGQARLRITLSAAHSAEDVTTLSNAVTALRNTQDEPRSPG